MKKNNEYFDVLDEQGNKTGKIKLRDLVHKDGNWHRTIHIWIYNNKGELLLQRRCSNKDSNPNMLSISCAGHLLSGDNSITAAVRELKEELNLVVDPKELHFIKTLKRSSISSSGFIDNEFCDIYILKIVNNIKKINFQKSEISEIIFVSFSNFKNMIINKHKDLRVSSETFELLCDIFDKH